MGLTIHPRVKRQVGARLATAAWNVAYFHDDQPFVGPVLAGCALERNGTVLRLKFDAELLKGDTVALREYNQMDRASVTWVKMGESPPIDADRNWRYDNRAPWWGDDESWTNVDISLDGGDVLALLPSGVRPTAVQYGHLSPKGHPQNGHDKICCGDRDFTKGGCPPESCPLSATASRLPAMPFHARIIGGKCKCFAPQVCDL